MYGTESSYNRVIITKGWKNVAGENNTKLNLDYIELGINDTDWILDKSNSTTEKIVLYYPIALQSEEESPFFMNSIRINNDILNNIMMNSTIDANGYRNITTDYAYNNSNVYLEIQIDAVESERIDPYDIQEIWGANVFINQDGTLSIR